MSEYEQYEEKPVITRLNHLLPELIERNNKQGKTLIRVNLFFEKREKKTWKNVMNIIDLSQNRRNSVKNGNYLKVII